ncbi:PIG-L deacetylase family protein [Actinomycetospora straminea]|uniref:N-acetyl-1-D-myo-inositol-2-amino-2-deoxy-alpha-D -glucopyranoside deacetylase n=1 Tax=Actinomycetospora straminea TaxID=663607 RepID=A0ABP9FAB6_9PSEU|nr:PIG-L family deacetylase [Actinomycetospora straminea]MDD7934084.1 PIG-L family deacetylase [Actinomycetospora straminea]
MTATAPATAPTVTTTDAVARLGTIVGVWAHPDDEAYLSAGVLAAAAAAGHRVVVVTATRGEHGTDDPGRYPPAQLAGVRAVEIVDSLAALHPAIEHRFLGRGCCHLDGALRPDPGTATVDELAALLVEVAPDTVLTFGPDGITGHGDHRAVSAWVDHAVRRLAAPPRVLHAAVTEAWVARFGEFVEPMDDSDDAFAPCPSDELVVDLELTGDLLERKVAALRAQASQTVALEAAVGEARYRDSVAGEYFRPAPLVTS